MYTHTHCGSFTLYLYVCIIYITHRT
uniref:Uncharacterized protein n=1 Tax=Anguilla anguilla TaxID=7936 RepID=A0A0E9T181_ANGAN